MQAPYHGSSGAEGHERDQGGTVSRVVQIPRGPWPFGEIVLVVSSPRMDLHELGWVDPDRDSLQTVFNRFLDDLALLLRTMRCFGPPFPPMSLPDKGG
ncbi:hypothetical protein GW7_20022 [Heterocephalus glaber]|uniref:Uncharacterized protein n=1 Tax=Heterocephalus glaber TaxID=10181 RepID=G5BYY7_HETGA|nr:hypothetical protein GW7_20022 [Heterocephalus glaber]